jgi:hypothetical protein
MPSARLRHMAYTHRECKGGLDDVQECVVYEIQVPERCSSVWSVSYSISHVMTCLGAWHLVHRDVLILKTQYSIRDAPRTPAKAHTSIPHPSYLNTLPYRSRKLSNPQPCSPVAQNIPRIHTPRTPPPLSAPTPDRLPTPSPWRGDMRDP